MFKKILVLVLTVISFSAQLISAERGFAIIVDKDTYTACRAEIENYRSVLEREGLSAVVVARVWSDPMQVKDVLHGLYLNKGLQGALFLGQIPIPMLRDAQHFTSAFKMDQELFPFGSSSVPSDRFYDDFDLKFDYLGKDSVKPLFHYYSLRGDSPQKIECDIYTGRIKPTREGEQGYSQIRGYFKKLLSERAKENYLDVITSYTGEGSFSNSITAWKEEGHTLREQFPNTFKDKNSVKFLLFNMYPYMKDVVSQELRRKEMDLMIFHEHGMPYRQYLTGIPYSKGISEYSEAARSLFRVALRKERDSQKREQMKIRWMEQYKIDSTWFAGVSTNEQLEKDSLTDANMGILLEDIPGIKPNARMVIFDACYNSDFREDSFIAGEYIFSEGKTLVTFGNSVNVLQDKSSSDLMGMLGMGFSVGEWARRVNILESHIIGDPTYRFKGDGPARVNLESREPDYWLSVLKLETHPDMQGLALHTLFNLNYQVMSDLLLQTYKSSPHYMVRLQCFHLLQYYNDGKFEELIKSSIYDPYEFIRRKSVFAMGRVGKDEYIPYIASVYLNDYLDERVQFNAAFCFDLMDMEKLENEVKAQLDLNTTFYDKEVVWADFKDRFDSRKRIAQMADDVTNPAKSTKARLSAVRMLRNNAYHNKVEDLLKILKDPKEDLAVRTALAEALGWFNLSYKRGEIVAVCKEASRDKEIDPKLLGELTKTIARLEVYMR
ncbi:MAG: hypothetical protein A2X20_03695 [Bacteroidetes bacterium GWE2_40_15]|nr:MAG: hypothetical protein A2X20_03695 [Bacteroidetes bacterium GWE2_40_15]